MAGEDGQGGASREPLSATSPPTAVQTWGLALPTWMPMSLSPLNPQGWRAGAWGHFQEVGDGLGAALLSSPLERDQR